MKEDWARATCPDLWNQVAFRTVRPSSSLGSDHHSRTVTSSCGFEPVEGAVVSSFLRFAEAPAAFPIIVDFTSNIRDMSADKQSQSDLRFVSLVRAAQGLAAQSN